MNEVSVNGTAIPEAAIASEMQHHPSPTPQAARQAAARALAIRALLLDRARTLGLRAEPLTDEEGRRETEEDALIRQLLEAEVKTPEPDEASLRRYYDNNRRRFVSPEIFEASHILISADRADAASYRRAVAEAEAMIVMLREHPERFESLARSRSACPSAAQGGNLGQISRGQTTPEFESFLMALDDGQLCPVPVKTRYGVHVLKLHRRIPGRELPFELVRDRIAAFLQDAVWRRAVSHYIRVLAAKARVEGVELAPAQTPLVQ